MLETAEPKTFDFNRYPPVGEDDWQYTFAAARVRALEGKLLSHNFIMDLANAPDLAGALDLLSSTDYAISANTSDFAEIERVLIEQRSLTRHLFKEIITNKELIELLLEKSDFANLRLALRRKLTEKPIGSDYSNDGSIPAEEFEQIFETENYAPLPEHMQEAIEAAVLAYYAEKNVRNIDLAIDKYRSGYLLRMARKIKSSFLECLFRVNIDMTNIRTLLRMKLMEMEDSEVFHNGGYIDTSVLRRGLVLEYEAIAAFFASTPYYEIVDSGVGYLQSNGSFLKLEANIDKYIRGFLKETRRVTAGLQPVVAYLLRKEAEIRTLRLILTAKKNNLDTKLIHDRLGE